MQKQSVVVLDGSEVIVFEDESRELFSSVSINYGMITFSSGATGDFLNMESVSFLMTELNLMLSELGYQIVETKEEVAHAI